MSDTSVSRRARCWRYAKQMTVVLPHDGYGFVNGSPQAHALTVKKFLSLGWTMADVDPAMAEASGLPRFSWPNVPRNNATPKGSP